MAEQDKKLPVSLQELMVSTLAMADAVTKLLIEKASSLKRNLSRSLWRNGQPTSGF